MTTTITKTTSSKTVDAFRSTSPQRIDADIVVVEAYSRSLNDHGTYDHSMRVRPATATETLTVEQAESVKTLGETLEALLETELDAIIDGKHGEWKTESREARSRYVAAVNATK